MTKLSDAVTPRIIYVEGSAPSTPPSGVVYVYAKPDGLMYSKDDAGVETLMSGGIAGIPNFAAYTPALTASSSNPTLGSGSAATGRYTQAGKIVVVHGSISFGSSGTAAGSGEYYISLPVTASSTTLRCFGSVVMYDASVGGFILGVAYNQSTTVFRIAVQDATTATVQHNDPIPWAANDVIIFQLTYEAA